MKNEDIKLMKNIKTPAYVVDERLLVKNLELLKSIQDRTGAKILLALKGFSMYKEFPLIGEYLAGITSSSLNEAKLGRNHMNKEVHIYAPAFRPDEIEEISEICDHIVFNSVEQISKFKSVAQGINNTIEFGLRINPEYSEVETEIYNPCARNSRLGAKLSTISHKELEGIQGLHFHTMCEQNSDTLERTIKVVEEKFGHFLHNMKWINFGGGHHITREDYDVEKLVALINRIKDTYSIDVYLEPGEAVALNCGYLVTSVLDIIDNNMQLGILDTSAACHMPDVIEMPYRPYIINSGQPREYQYNYRFGGLTCLAGDIIGDYSFEKMLTVGDKLIFTDMAHYTMVKNNTFNGVKLPAIAILNDDGIEIIREFGYKDYESRLS